MYSILFANFHTSSTETLTVYLVPAGSSAGDSTTILKSYDIPAKRTLIWTAEEPLFLDPGDSIVAIGATGSLVTSTVNYVPERRRA